MSKTYTKVGKGAFFQQDNSGNDKAPSFKGNADISGREFDIALWPRTSKNGHNYLSVQFCDKGQREACGDGAFFERNNANPKAPRLSGPVEIEGHKFEAAIWPAIFWKTAMG